VWVVVEDPGYRGGFPMTTQAGEPAATRTQPFVRPAVQAPNGNETSDEHRLRGKAARARAPRSRHAEFTPKPGRESPIDVLEAQAARRVPELNPVRYGRMLASPFAFFRGAAALMAADLATTPVSGFTTQICGDAHLANFGLYASPERHLVFDLNDFDETIRGPWEWDVKRLCASLEIAGRDRGFSRGDRRQAVLSAASGYREAMTRFATMRHLDLWYEHDDVEDPAVLSGLRLDEKSRGRVEGVMAKARTRSRDRAVHKHTEIRDGERRFVSGPPLLMTLDDLLPEAEREELKGRLQRILRDYRRSLQPDRRWLLEQYRLVDLARKVVGVGSVGTRCFVVLLVGHDEEDTMILQVKEAGPSVLAAYVGESPVRNQGQRVVLGQRHMQAATDIFLGWHRTAGLDGLSRDFYVRQLADWKGGADLDRLRPLGLARYGELCGRTLARAHARSGDRIAIAGYLGTSDTFDRALADFAAAYAEQNATDHRLLQEAVTSGRIRATFGV
jgi:uncharacterized protein (DUF2252 family)